jgi:pimeloyl-ACP methyl ester carboxylesterase
MSPAEERPLAGAGSRWIGAPALDGGKGYAACPLGALHYRKLSGDPSNKATPFLLLHQTPFGLAEWVDIQPLLAAAGRTVIAPDNPGYGMSDSPPAGLTVAMLADNLIALLDQLAVGKVVVAGHHTGAAIAAAFAARHPTRTAAVVLHGCPLYTAAERAERLARVPPPFEPQPDGSHFATLFNAIYRVAGQRPEALIATSWAALGSYLAGANTPTYKAVFSNDMSQDILAIRAPALVLSDRGDMLRDKDSQVAALRRDFTLQEFSDAGSFALMLEPRRWVEAVSAFANAKGL